MIHSINHEFVHCCYNFDRPNYEMKTYLSLAIDSFMNLEKIFFSFVWYADFQFLTNIDELLIFYNLSIMNKKMISNFWFT